MAAAGRVYPQFGSPHLRRLTIGPEWKHYRGVDWGGRDPTVCLWVAHNPRGEPGLFIDPDCTDLTEEMYAYQWAERQNMPRDANNHGPDTLRYIVTHFGLDGTVYVYRALYIRNAAEVRLDGIAMQIHKLSGWEVPNGDLERAHPGANGTLFDGGVADRSQPLSISQLCTWRVPLVGQTKPKKVTGRGEIMDGIAAVQVLLGGTTRFHQIRRDEEIDDLARALSKLRGYTNALGRPCALTEKERDAILDEARIVERIGTGPDHTWLLD